MRHSGTLFLILLAACGGGTGSQPVGGGGGGGGGGSPAAQTVEESLQRLGVNTAGGARVDAGGQALPEDWTPLGPACRVNQLDELFLTGAFPEGGADLFESRFLPVQDFDGEAWAHPAVRRATAAGDFDADGREELLVVIHDPDAARMQVDVELIDDAVAGHATLAAGTIALLPDDAPRLAAVAGDFDGDGDAEAALGIVVDAGVDILFCDFDAGVVRQIGGTLRLASQVGGQLHVSLRVGQVDGDPAQELVYVVNEYFDNDPAAPFRHRNATARFGLLDDAAADFAPLTGGAVGANVAGILRTAKSAAAALADVDADGIDEVVLGGLTYIGRPGVGIEAPQGGMGFLLYALDDVAHGFADLGGHFEPYANPNTNDRPDLQWIEYVPLSAADLDGDTVPEVQIAHLLYAWEDGVWVVAGSFPFHEMVFPDEPRVVFVSQDNTRSAVGRVVTGTRDNILVWSDELAGSLRVWGMPGGAVVREDIKAVDRIECIQPVDVDTDTLALEYVPGSHELVFTEPVILAVLAAAPCGPGQDPGDCRTQFGVSDSAGTETEQAVTMTAGTVVGVSYDFNIPFFPLSVEATRTMTETVERSTARAYEVTQTVVWETGPVEDSVIFTSVPYDQYRYRVVQPGDDERLRDREILVWVPRRPVHLMVSRAFYDAHVVEGAPEAGAAFSHTPGDTSTYRTFAQAMNLVAAHDGIASDSQDVGQGGGNVSVTLEVGRAYTQGTSITEEWTSEVRATAGTAMGGYSVGESSTNALRLTTGRSLLYGGTVGQIDAEHFDRHAFSFGIFAYPRQDQASGRAYQVIDFWVTPLR